MTEEEQAPAVEETAPPPAPEPPPPSEPTYTQEELTAQAQELGVYPWDIAGIFKSAGVQSMTEAEFQQALEAWRAPIPVEGSN
jgi:hypothetical protein